MHTLITDIAYSLASAFLQLGDRSVASWTFPMLGEAVKVTVERVSPVTVTDAWAYAEDETLLGVPV